MKRIHGDCDLKNPLKNCLFNENDPVKWDRYDKQCSLGYYMPQASWAFDYDALEDFELLYRTMRTKYPGLPFDVANYVGYKKYKWDIKPYRKARFYKKPTISRPRAETEYKIPKTLNFLVATLHNRLEHEASLFDSNYLDIFMNIKVDGMIPGDLEVGSEKDGPARVWAYILGSALVPYVYCHSGSNALFEALSDSCTLNCDNTCN